MLFKGLKKCQGGKTTIVTSVKDNRGWLTMELRGIRLVGVESMGVSQRSALLWTMNSHHWDKCEAGNEQQDNVLAV